MDQGRYYAIISIIIISFYLLLLACSNSDVCSIQIMKCKHDGQWIKKHNKHPSLPLLFQSKASNESLYDWYSSWSTLFPRILTKEKSILIDKDGN